MTIEHGVFLGEKLSKVQAQRAQEVRPPSYKKITYVKGISTASLCSNLRVFNHQCGKILNDKLDGFFH